MRIIYDPEHRRHHPRTELLYGKPIAHPDVSERVETIVQALAGTRWEPSIAPPSAYPLDEAVRVHDPAYVAHLAARLLENGSAEPDEEWFPYTWPAHRSLDTGTPLLGETRDVAWRSASVALTGADALLGGETSAYALCRPPGHHAARGAMGGYCYFNNAALAAERLLRLAPQSGRVAILDLDIHHGNGTQDIFYASDRVAYASIHLVPEEGYPPHTGFATETGTGAGVGYNLNQPLPVGTAWPDYSDALARALAWLDRAEPSHLVVSQGFDTFEGDRWGGFLLRAEHFAAIGERLRAFHRPVLAVLEGGYEPAHLAAGSLALLDGLSPAA